MVNDFTYFLCKVTFCNNNLIPCVFALLDVVVARTVERTPLLPSSAHVTPLSLGSLPHPHYLAICILEITSHGRPSRADRGYTTPSITHLFLPTFSLITCPLVQTVARQAAYHVLWYWTLRDALILQIYK